ncbi:MAG: alpha/beta hydrolase [Archangiaceae bacterium]|nr:alpha/beta hydrolase [Archangiaceae bacterium]
MSPRVMALAAGLLASSCAFRAWVRPSTLPEGGLEKRDVAYWEGEGFDTAKHRLDVYAPKGPGPYPVVVFVHGGGWILGDRQQPGGNYVQLGRRLASQGVVAVIPSYRLAATARHPAQVEDVARALTWALHHAPELNGDPTRVFAMGHSAGAQLVALAACDPRYLGALGAAPSQLAGVIAISGPYDVSHFGRSLFLGGFPMVIPTFGWQREAWSDAMPANHLREGQAPPFLLAWADGDPELLRRDGEKFAKALEAAHVSVETFETSFDDHLSIITDFADDGNALTARALEFLHLHRAAEAKSSAQTRGSEVIGKRGDSEVEVVR